MNKGKWNNADKVLAAAGGAFTVSLYAVAQYPENVLLQGIHFCTEAALVGGIADWFAVTALFERPLGFPYHTAILPGRRHEFMEAMVQLIQQEFFSHRKIFSLLKGMNLQDQAITWLKNAEIENIIQNKLHEKISAEIDSFDFSKTVNVLADDIRASIRAVSADLALRWLCQQVEGEKGQSFLRELSAYLLLRVDTPEMRSRIMGFLEKYQQEKTQSQGMMAQFLTGLASAMGVLNLEEATDIIQKHLIKLLENAQLINSSEYKDIQTAFLQELNNLENSGPFIELCEEIKYRLAESLPLEELLSSALLEMKKTAQLNVPSEENALITLSQEKNYALILEEYVMEVVAKLPERLTTEQKLQACFDELLHDASSRCMLYAREVSEHIVRSVLADLSDEKLNQLVYEKVEPDMLWIRMNGSIVGAIVGLMIFVLMNVVKIY